MGYISSPDHASYRVPKWDGEKRCLFTLHIVYSEVTHGVLGTACNIWCAGKKNKWVRYPNSHELFYEGHKATGFDEKGNAKSIYRELSEEIDRAKKA